MKQSINSRKIHEINHIDVGQEDEIEINEAHVRNPNYKGKNYDPNFMQNRLKNNRSTNNTSNNYNSNTKSNYKSSNQHNSNTSGYGHSKSHQQEKPVNVSVTLHGLVSKIPTFDNKHNYNALYDTGAGASLINYSAYVSLGQDLDTGY